jgi:protein ImuA
MLIQQTFEFAVEALPAETAKKKTLRRPSDTSSRWAAVTLPVPAASRPTAASRPALPTPVPAPTLSPAALVNHSTSPTASPLDILNQLRRDTKCILKHSPLTSIALVSATDSLAGDASAIGRQTATSSKPVLSTGSTTLDRWLPQGGLPADGITQYIAEGDGSAAGSLSLIAVAHRSQGPIVVVARSNQFYPPSAAALGIPLDRLIWVRPTSRRDAVWSIDQALRCRSVACVWAMVDERLDPRDARRIQLAAETGGTPAILVRPAAAARNRLNFASISFRVGIRSVDPARLPESLAATINPDPIIRVTLDRCRGRVDAAQTYLQITRSARVVDLDPQLMSWFDEPISIDRSSSTAMPLVAQLAHPKTKHAVVDRRRRA